MAMTHRFPLLIPVLAASFALPAQAASPFGDMPIEGNWTLETVPRDDSVPFPLDAFPVIRIGDAPLSQMGEAEPTIFHLPTSGDPARLRVSIESVTVPMPGGSIDWIRIFPDELLVDGERYELRFQAIVADGAEPTEDAMRAADQFIQVQFVAGPSDARAPIAPDHEVRVLDHGLVSNGPFSGATHRHSINVDVSVADADFAPHDTWLLFEVQEDFDGDVADLDPTRWVAPAILTSDETVISSWTYRAPNDDGRRCVIAATEDAYGAIDASDAVCADPISAACDGCSSVGPSKGGAAAILGMMFAVGSRRRRSTL
jgi:uncharacterized protein (TIGR03382 family)